MIEEISRISKQSLITIPMKIRNKFEMSEGTYVKWIVNDDDIIIIQPVIIVKK